jgi:hypothetical protein
MPTFRDREKSRLGGVKPRLFTPPACVAGVYKGKEREFAIDRQRASENLWVGIRKETIAYFHERGIAWHDGLEEPEGEGSAGQQVPSNHLCCSQTCCLNFWFPFVTSPRSLEGLLRRLGYDVEGVLPMSEDKLLGSGEWPLVSFEWIGRRNYLREGPGGKPVVDSERTRGANATSADFAFRFRQRDGKVRVVLGEWKYTEKYGDRSIRFSGHGTDRLAVYRSALEAPDSPIRLGDLPPDCLFFDPFDQLMRLQLLAAAMEREKEMDADIVSVLHVAPGANRELMSGITSPLLRNRGADIHAVWASLVDASRFKGVLFERLLNAASESAPNPHWLDYMNLRYGGMA